MGFVKRNNLERYANRLYKISSKNVANQTVELLADKGKTIAEKEYTGTSISVTNEINDNVAQVIANGNQVAYLEYGTGVIGDGTYKGKLPTSGVPITGEWQYYYLPSNSKAVKDGKKGWYLKNGAFIEGRIAGNQMFNTAKSLREYVRSKDLARDLKRKLGE